MGAVDLWARPWSNGSFYWAVLGRLTMFMAAPLILALAAGLEARLDEVASRKVFVFSAAATLLLTLALSGVDFRYAGIQRDFAREVGRAYRQRAFAWYTGHWGFQHYLEEEGALPLEHSKGGWDLPSRGRRFVGEGELKRPAGVGQEAGQRPDLAGRAPLPLRLMSAEAGQAGFYPAGSGFCRSPSAGRRWRSFLSSKFFEPGALLPACASRDRYG